MLVVSLSMQGLSNQNQETVLNTLDLNPELGFKEFVFERMPSVFVNLATQPINWSDPQVSKFLMVTNEEPNATGTGRFLQVSLITLLEKANSYNSFTNYLYDILTPTTNALQQTGSPLTITATNWQTAPASNPTP